MGKLNLTERMIDPRSPDVGRGGPPMRCRPFSRRATSSVGTFSVIQSFQGAMIASAAGVGAEPHFELAAKCIGIAVFLDGLDGRIARMTNTTSDFGRKWIRSPTSSASASRPPCWPSPGAFNFSIHRAIPGSGSRCIRAGYFISFVFLLCGSARLARFNVQKNPVPKNPGKPDRKYFVGLAIPAAAGMVAAVVYAANSSPIHLWPFAVVWLALLGLLSFLMVSTWRYYSFKDINCFGRGRL
jgi:CDP-diacylglycerol--serine O-phosphatidyltransferase